MREKKTPIEEPESEKHKSCKLKEIHRKEDLPSSLTVRSLADFLHENMKPYEDSVTDIQRALEYAVVPGAGQGGFILLAMRDETLLGVIVILETGMGGYVPEHLLLFVGVRPEERGRGIGGRLIRAAFEHCPGQMKLHVEYDNPAKRLYERLGFTSKYAEMRISVSPGGRP